MWRDHLAQALHRSELLIPVWSPKYFESAGASAELETMRRREQLVNWAHPLIYPIRYSDGDSFPEFAKNIQHEVVLSKWPYPQPQFAETVQFLEFDMEVRSIARTSPHDSRTRLRGMKHGLSKGLSRMHVTQ